MVSFEKINKRTDPRLLEEIGDLRVSMGIYGLSMITSAIDEADDG